MKVKEILKTNNSVNALDQLLNEMLADITNKQIKTIEKDKTIDIKAFVDNLSEIFSKK